MFPGIGCPRFDGARDLCEWYTAREDQPAYAEESGEEDLFPDTGDGDLPPDLADHHGPGSGEAPYRCSPGNAPEEIHGDDLESEGW